MSCDEADKPTHLEALRALKKKLIDEHGACDHPVHPKAAEYRARLEANGDVETTESGDPAADRIIAMGTRQSKEITKYCTKPQNFLLMSR